MLIKGLEMPETEYMDVRIFRDGTAAIATGTKPYYRELKAEPVRHGKWIPHEDEDGEHYGDKCSECSEWYVMPYGKTNFCPHCGARMDKE